MSGIFRTRCEAGIREAGQGSGLPEFAGLQAPARGAGQDGSAVQARARFALRAEVACAILFMLGIGLSALLLVTGH